jgi:CRP-like cAMP-binding protein
MPQKKHLESLFKTIEREAILNVEMRNDLKHVIKIIHVEKGKVLLKEGTPCIKLYFLSKGLFRSYYLDTNGVEITSAFSFENEFFTNVKGFVNYIDSTETIEALEPSFICVIDRNDYFQILQKFPPLFYISHQTINKHRVELEDRIRMLQNTLAKDKLAFFDQYYPGLKNRVPKKHIASFLGMRYETMNRTLKANH